jgi:hypothetical protein
MDYGKPPHISQALAIKLIGLVHHAAKKPNAMGQQ